MTNRLAISIALCALISISLASCGVRRPERTPPIMFPADNSNQRGTVLPNVGVSSFLYVKVRDDVKQNSLEQLAKLTEPFVAVKPANVSLRRFLNQYYGTASRKFQRVSLSQNPSSSAASKAGQPITIELFGGPVFSRDLIYSDAYSSYPYMIGDAYLKLRPEFLKQPAFVDQSLATIRANDGAMLAAYRLPDLPVLAGGPDCPENSGPASLPYETLDGFKPNFEGDPVTIAVVDSGIGLSKVASKDPSPLKSDDPGYYDPRIYLWDRGTSGHKAFQGCPNEVHGCNIVDSTADIKDTNGHGTHIAGLCSGFSDKGNIAPKGKIFIMVMKVADGPKMIPRHAPGDGVTHAIWNGAKIVNLSLAAPAHETLDDALNLASLKKVLLVVAAGNGLYGNPGHSLTTTGVNDYLAAQSWPHSDTVIVVAALNGKDQVPEFSNWNQDFAGIAAPGVLIDSTWPVEDHRTMCGTSQAAALVSLTAAMLVLQKPNITSQGIIQRLQASSDYVSSLEIKHQVKFGAKLNMRKALDSSTDLVETKTELMRGEIDKAKTAWEFMVSGYSFGPWSDVLRIDFGLQGGNRVLYTGNDEVSERKGDLNFDTLWFRKDGDKEFQPIKTKDIRTIILKMH